jgi:hypothetical protein
MPPATTTRQATKSSCPLPQILPRLDHLNKTDVPAKYVLDIIQEMKNITKLLNSEDVFGNPP